MSVIDRRTLLKASALFAGAYGIGLGAASRFSPALAAPEPVLLKAQGAEVMLAEAGPTKGLMTYVPDGMPPTLRVKRGEPFHAKLTNGLDEPTTVHWHGVRVPNAMDGVPFLTQPYVYTGDSFDYRFSPPDAGTFWYHPHCNTLEQMGRGMTGLLIVESPDDPAFDADIAVNLRDWRLGGDGQFIEQFKPRESAKGGTLGTLRTANWRREPQYEAPTGGLLRLRLAATDVTRIFAFTMEGAEAEVIALDGNPVPQRFALDRLMIGPGQRLDLAVKMPDSEGMVATLRDVRGSVEKTVVTLKATGASLKRDLRDLPKLAANPVPAVDLSSAQQIPLLLSASAEKQPSGGFCGSIGYTFWAINKTPWSGDTPDPSAPLAELKHGKSYVLNLENPTPHIHPIHLHGMSFVVLSSTLGEMQPFVTDTYLIKPDEKVRLGLVADNPGDWVFHCHIIEHQKTGMTGYLRVV